MSAYLQDLVQSIGSAPADAAVCSRAAYVKLLCFHDWRFEYSDDHSVWTRGRESLAQLRMLQRELDPTGEIWRSHCPAGHEVR